MSTSYCCYKKIRQIVTSNNTHLLFQSVSFQGSKMGGQGYVTSGSSREEPCFLAFQKVLEVVNVLWILGLHHSDIFFGHHISSSDSEIPASLFQIPFLLHQAYPDDSGKYSHLKIINLVTSAISLSPCKVTIFTGFGKQNVHIFCRGGGGHIKTNKQEDQTKTPWKKTEQVCIYILQMDTNIVLEDTNINHIQEIQVFDCTKSEKCDSYDQKFLTQQENVLNL